MKNWLKNLKQSEAMIIAAIIGVIAAIVAGFFAIQAAIAPKRLEIETTQTAEARLTELALPFTRSPTVTSSPILTPITFFTETSTPTSTITPIPTPDCRDIKVSHLELDLATGLNQRRDPDAKGVINLTSKDIGTLAMLSGDAIRSGTNVSQCTCNWEGRTNVNSALEPTGGKIGCGFSIAIPEGVTAIYLKLSINGRDTLFTIRVQQQ